MKYIKINELYEEKYKKYYYLVVRIPDYKYDIESERVKEYEPLIFGGLQKGVFTGLKGISDNIDILNAFFDIRDMLLVMPKDSVDNINNNLFKIDYFDVHKLCENDMFLLRRIYQENPDYKLSHLFSQIENRHSLFRDIKSNMFKVLKKHLSIHQLNKFYKIRKKALEIDILYLIENTVYKVLDGIEINSFDELVDIFYTYYKTVDVDILIRNMPYMSYQSGEELKLKIKSINRQMVSDSLRYIIVAFGCCFLSEGEILVNDKNFNIPNDTIIFLKTKEGSIIKDIVAKYNLDDFYKIKYVKDVTIKFKSLAPYFAKTLIRNI